MVTCTVPSRNSVDHQRFLGLVEQSHPVGDNVIVTDNLSSHNSKSTCEWLLDHPWIQHVFIPVAACRLNTREGWRLFRRTASAGQSFAGPPDIAHATRTATAGSTPAPTRGLGTQPRNREPVDAVLCTAFEERSTVTAG